MGLCSRAGFSYRPLLLLTLATTASVGKVQFTCMLLRIMTGYLIVIKIPWNYGKLIFHARSVIMAGITAPLPLSVLWASFGFSRHWGHFCGGSFSSGYFRSSGALPDRASFLHAAAPLSPSPPTPRLGAGICTGTWTPFVVYSRPGYKWHVNLSSRGVAEPPGRFLRSSAVPKMRSHTTVNPLLETVRLQACI